MPDAFLGLNLLHDTSAALVVDGELVAAAEQERFNGERHTTAFPAEAIEYCLEHAGIRPRDVRETAVAFDYDLFEMDPSPLARSILTAEDTGMQGTATLATWRDSIAQLGRHGLPNICYLRHHLTHAACGYYMSDFDEAGVLVVDGRGERESTTFWHAAGPRIEHLDSYGVADSLGHMYSYVTGLCGLYSSFGNEGKTMGLAGYGKGKFAFDKVLTFDSQRYHLHWDELHTFDPYMAPLGQPDGNSAELAFAVQQRLEQAFQFLVERLESRTGCRALVLAGGVALNCNANATVLGLPQVERLFIPPAANDAGTSAGAAFLRWVEFSGRRPARPPSPVYLGPAITSHDADSAVTAQGLEWPPRRSRPAIRWAGLRAGPSSARGLWAIARYWPTPATRQCRASSTSG
jgi:carbamoyltransferase